MKRNLSRFVLLVIVVSFALSILSIGVFAESVDLSKYGRYMLSKMPGGADLVKTYDEFEAAIDAGLTTVDFSTLIPMETFSNYIYTALENDHPEWYYFERNSTPVYYQNAEGFPVVKANPAYNKLNASSYKTAFDNAVKACIALSGVTNEMSDYEKSLRIHDALCKTVTYDYSLSGENIYNAYGALVEGSAVCQGYAKAYQYLLKQVGISSSVVTGLSYNVATAQTDRHMWNIVLLDGEYYLTDVTWDDQNGDIFHGYLNVTTDTMSEDHITQMVYDVPLCTATANNYFLKNGGIVYVKDSAPYVENENEVYNYVKSGISTTGVAKIFVIGTNKGNIFSWYNSVVNKLVNDLGYTGTINIGATYVGREFHLIMSAEHGQSTTPTTSTTVTTATTPTTSTTATTATTPTTSTTATTATTPTTSTAATTATTPTTSTTATTATT
ncbi:MAG: hypothetical protein MJ236_02700, partial [Clostridia bacterium]|nr:hypothetical protein [Clostridia bacterium]